MKQAKHAPRLAILRAWGVRAALAALLAVSAIGCAKPAGPEFEFEWDYDPAVKFADLRSFAWIPDERVAVGDPRIDDADLEQRVREAADRALAAKGYAPDTSGAPDFWLAYHASLKRRLDARAMNTNYGPDPTRAWHPDQDVPQPGEYEAGTLVLDVIAPDAATLMWRGRVQTRVNLGSDSLEVRQARLEDAVEGMLAGFPPAP